MNDETEYVASDVTISFNSSVCYVKRILIIVAINSSKTAASSSINFVFFLLEKMLKLT